MNEPRRLCHTVILRDMAGTWKNGREKRLARWLVERGFPPAKLINLTEITDEQPNFQQIGQWVTMRRHLLETNDDNNRQKSGCPSIQYPLIRSHNLAPYQIA